MNPEYKILAILLGIVAILSIMWSMVLTYKLADKTGRLRFMEDWVECMDKEHEYLGLHSDVRDRCLEKL